VEGVAALDRDVHGRVVGGGVGGVMALDAGEQAAGERDVGVGAQRAGADDDDAALVALEVFGRVVAEVVLAAQLLLVEAEGALVLGGVLGEGAHLAADLGLDGVDHAGAQLEQVGEVGVEEDVVFEKGGVAAEQDVADVVALLEGGGDLGAELEVGGARGAADRDVEVGLVAEAVGHGVEADDGGGVVGEHGAQLLVDAELARALEREDPDQDRDEGDHAGVAGDEGGEPGAEAGGRRRHAAGRLYQRRGRQVGT
jgi:hypothetical protein